MRLLGVVAVCALAVSCATPASPPPQQGNSTSPVFGGPGCPTPHPAAAVPLNTVRTEMVSVSGRPLGVVTTADGRWAFVSLNTSIAVFDTTTSPPRLMSHIPLAGQPVGETLTADGHYLLAALGGGAVVIDTSLAEAGATGAEVGALASSEQGAVEVAVTPDSQFAIVAMEGSAEAAVFNLGKAFAQAFASSSLVGSIPLGDGPVGMAFSPDHRWLYALSEARAGMGGAKAAVGTLSVIDVAHAETQPATSVVATVAAGCGPVRVAVSADGSTVWVTARESDELLSFSTARLRDDPERAAGAVVGVGAAPVGLALVDHDRLVIVADSNRFQATGATANLEVIDAQAALNGKSALVGSLPSGRFPRNMAIVPGSNALLVTNFDSEQLEAIDLSSLPGSPV